MSMHSARHWSKVGICFSGSLCWQVNCCLKVYVSYFTRGFPGTVLGIPGWLFPYFAHAKCCVYFYWSIDFFFFLILHVCSALPLLKYNSSVLWFLFFMLNLLIKIHKDMLVILRRMKKGSFTYLKFPFWVS